MRKRMRLEWSAYAQADRDAIFDFIEVNSRQAAITVDDRIREQVETLARFPQSGRTGRTVRILRVLHGSRRWPDDMSEEAQE
jgi:toxin ParE1/3/4